MTKLEQAMILEISKLSFIRGPVELSPIIGGAMNSSYELHHANEKYFVKTFESDLFAKLDRPYLFDLQKRLHQMAVAPLPIYLSKTNGFQIDQWVDENNLEESALGKLEQCKVLASTLAHIHTLNIEADAVDLPSQWRHYLKVLGELASPSQTQVLKKYESIWRSACEQELCFCHNDLSLMHITESSKSMVFDWEYAGLSCPYFDLASSIVVNDLDHADQTMLCAHYSQLRRISLQNVLKKTQQMLPLVRLTNSLWYRCAKQATPRGND